MSEFRDGYDLSGKLGRTLPPRPANSRCSNSVGMNGSGSAGTLVPAQCCGFRFQLNLTAFDESMLFGFRKLASAGRTVSPKKNFSPSRMTFAGSIPAPPRLGELHQLVKRADQHYDRAEPRG